MPTRTVPNRNYSPIVKRFVDANVGKSFTLAEISLQTGVDHESVSRAMGNFNKKKWVRITERATYYFAGSGVPDVHQETITVPEGTKSISLTISFET